MNLFHTLTSLNPTVPYNLQCAKAWLPVVFLSYRYIKYRATQNERNLNLMKYGDPHCCGLNVCASTTPYPLPKFICWNLMPNMMALGGGAFGRCLGHEGGLVSRNGISALMKETPQNSLAPSTTWGHSEKMPFMNQEVGQTSHQIPDQPVPRSWTSRTPELWEKDFCCL